MLRCVRKEVAEGKVSVLVVRSCVALRCAALVVVAVVVV